MKSGLVSEINLRHVEDLYLSVKSMPNNRSHLQNHIPTFVFIHVCAAAYLSIVNNDIMQTNSLVGWLFSGLTSI